MKELLIMLLLAAALIAAAHIGAARSERAHRALDSKYQVCADRNRFGTPAFRDCVWGAR